MKSRVSGILIAWMIAIIATHSANAADDVNKILDEVDKMLIVEASTQKAAVTNDVVKPAQEHTVQPAQPVVTVLTNVVSTPASSPVMLTDVQASPVTVVSNTASTPTPVAVTPDPVVVSLQKELMLREEELVKANGEVERLKGIVRKIHDANRRESLVFHYNMAAIYRSNMLYRKAEEAYLKALEIDPRDAGVHYNLAILYDDNFKDKKKAKYHYEKFLELAPEDADAPKVREWLSSIL